MTLAEELRRCRKLKPKPSPRYFLARLAEIRAAKARQPLSRRNGE